MESWYIDADLPKDYTIMTTPKGYTDEIIEFQLIQCFHEFTKYRAKGQFRMLLMNNHASI
jgi:hypothetical protein